MAVTEAHPQDCISIIVRLAQAVEAVREILESNNPELLEDAVRVFEEIHREIELFPGGASAIALELNSLAKDKNEEYRALLEKARLQHETNQEMIRLAIQRNAALQSYSAQANLAATYSNEGGVPLGNVGKLLGKV